MLVSASAERQDFAGPAAEGAGGLTADAVLEQVRLAKDVRFDLGRLELAAAPARALLEGLTEARLSKGYDLDLSCEIGIDLADEEVRRLASAGVARARLAAGQMEKGFPPLWLRQIDAVRRLHEAAVAPEWCLSVRSDEEAAAVADAPAHSLLHLPPPQGLDIRGYGEGDGSVRLRDRIETWRSGHCPRMLTYARGPGFCRILDRREDPRNWRFVEFRGVQAGIFLDCRTARRAAALRDDYGEQNWPAVSAFLERLTELGLVCSTRDRDWFLALAVRRSKNERWTTGDHQ